MEEFLDPEYVKNEDERILTMATAMYIHIIYPELTIAEIFEKLQDVEFVKDVIRKVMEDINVNGGDS